MTDFEYEKYISELFDKIKRKDASDDMVSIPVVNDDGYIEAILKPITYDYERLFPDCIYYMSKWRIENPTLSNSVFQVTDERTKNWLDNLILKRKDRLLFFIDTLDNKHIGHIAYSSFDFVDRTAEIDAVLRGEDILPGIMTKTINSMIRWADNNLLLSSLQLRVNDDNTRAIALYERCGFEAVSRIPLFRRELEGEIRWDEDKNRDINEAERFELLMKKG